jgi:hypothetical protein
VSETPAKSILSYRLLGLFVYVYGVTSELCDRCAEKGHKDACRKVYGPGRQRGSIIASNTSSEIGTLARWDSSSVLKHWIIGLGGKVTFDLLLHLDCLPNFLSQIP